MNENYTLHKNVWDYYKKRVTKLLGYSYNTARKTFNTYALELQVSDTIRRVLLGHTDSSMLSPMVILVNHLSNSNESAQSNYIIAPVAGLTEAPYPVCSGLHRWPRQGQWLHRVPDQHS